MHLFVYGTLACADMLAALLAREVPCEAAVLGGYARYIRKRHPNAPVPGFYMSERLFSDAQSMRGHVGDEKFFKFIKF